MTRLDAEIILENWKEHSKTLGFGNRNFRGDLVLRLLEAALIIIDDYRNPPLPIRRDVKPR